MRSLVKEFKGIAVTKSLTVMLTPADNARVRSAVLSAVEIVAQSP